MLSARKSLTGAYEQVLQYREALDNPPLLVVSDFKRFEVHTQWTNERKRVYKFELQDLLHHKPTETCPLPPTEVLAALFRDPEAIRPGKMAERVTEDASRLFGQIAERIELQGPHRLTAEGKEEVARFLIRLLFCFFADAVGLLPGKVFREAIRRVTPTSTFETFPFPWPPGKEPKRDPRVKAIAAAAKELVEKRDAWLNPENTSPEDLAKRTLTNLYNERPAWLDHLHARLDAAVFAAYGWPMDPAAPLTDDEILKRLLELNRERSGAGAGAA